VLGYKGGEGPLPRHVRPPSQKEGGKGKRNLEKVLVFTKVARSLEKKGEKKAPFRRKEGKRTKRGTRVLPMGERGGTVATRPPNLEEIPNHREKNNVSPFNTRVSSPAKSP